MHYLGGKYRIAKKIAEVINSYDCAAVWEPFCGACWVTAEIEHKHIYASDLNNFLIEMWRKIQQGWVPPDVITEEEYKNIKDNKRAYPPELVAFAGIGQSWGGKWFGGYARDGTKRNYAKNAKSSLLKIAPSLLNVKFSVRDFVHSSVVDVSDFVIYCDPPYEGTTQYDAVAKFDHNLFWERCRKYAEMDNIVLVSEYSAPDDFTEVASFSTKTDIRDKNNNKTDRTERLFTYGT